MQTDTEDIIESSIESSTTTSSSDEKIVKRRGRPRKWENQTIKQIQRPNSVLYDSPLGYHYIQPHNSRLLYVNPLIQRGFHNSFPSATGYNVNTHTINYYQNAPTYKHMNIQPRPSYVRQNYSSKPKSEEVTSYVPGRRQKRAASVQAKQIENTKTKELIEDSYSYEEEDNIEKLLSYDQEKDAYLVKFRYKSYLHCDYVKREEIAQTKGGAIKVKRFRPPAVPIDPDYLKVDRIIHEDYKDVKTFLVKWKKMNYELSTYETIDDVSKCEGFEEELKKYRDRKKMRTMRYSLDWRPPRELQVKFDNTATFKGGNKLKEYQLEGLNWLLNRWYYKVSCIMADEMGLGKTVQSVVFINSLYTKFEYVGPVLVVAPLSTLGHWEREFQAWTDLRVLIYHGTYSAREMIAKYEFFLKTNNTNIRLFDVLITTYEMVTAGFDHLTQFNYAVGIFDEAHKLKNYTSKASRTLRHFSFNFKVLLSGTPLQNNITELWSLLNFINPVEYGDLNKFLDEHKLENIEDVEKLQALLRPIMLRRMKEDVEKTIPTKEETIIEVELTMIQKRFYRAILEKNLGFLSKDGTGPALNLLNVMMQLRKCCIHPYLLEGAENKIISDYLRRKKKEACENAALEKDDMNLLEAASTDTKVPGKEDIITDIDEYYKILIQSSGKLVLLDKLLDKLYGKHKVLIFSQMTTCLDLLSDYLAYKKYKYERIDGGVRSDHRQAAIDRFSDKDSDIFVFLLCTRAGGAGINLTAADTVVIFDSDWNPQNDLQAQARCHRIGQTNEVKIYRLVTRNSYEREMFDKASMKLGLGRAVLQKMFFEGKQPEKISNKESIEVLLKKGAYGVLMETDEASKKFCEEDIDQILERRTRVIRHSDEENVFSKASFQVDEEIDDPDFWDNLLNKKKNEENEGRVKRQMRRLAREESSLAEDNENIAKLLESNLESGSNMDQSVIQCLKIFLYCIKEGMGSVGLKFEADKLVYDSELDKYKFEDTLLKFKWIMKYCVDQLGNQKLRSDFSYCIEQALDENYDPSLFENYKDIYSKYGEKFLLRMQLVFILNYLLQTEQLFVEKNRGWNQDDDKKLVESIYKYGYGVYPVKIRNKSPEECNQRIRKIISTLNRMKEMAETDSIHYKAIMTFGNITELNEDKVIKFLESRDISALRETISKILNTSRRSRTQSESECFERIAFFEKLAGISRDLNVRKISMPKGWTKEKDYQLVQYLLENGLNNIEEEFGISTELAMKRCDSLIKHNNPKNTEE